MNSTYLTLPNVYIKFNKGSISSDVSKIELMVKFNDFNWSGTSDRNGLFTYITDDQSYWWSLVLAKHGNTQLFIYREGICIDNTYTYQYREVKIADYENKTITSPGFVDGNIATDEYPNNWRAIVFDKTTWQISIDGEVFEFSDGITITNYTNPLYCAIGTANDLYYTGDKSIQNVKLYNSNNTLLHDFPCQEGDGVIIHDSENVNVQGVVVNVAGINQLPTQDFINSLWVNKQDFLTYNISDTYGNIMHLNCVDYTQIYDIESYKFTIYDGYGHVLPLSFNYNTSLHNIQNDPSCVNKATLYVINLNSNSIYPNPSIVITNNIQIPENKCNLDSLKTVYLSNAITIDNNAADNIIGNIEYVKNIFNIWRNDFLKNITNQLDIKDKLVWSYYNNRYGTPPVLSFKVTEDNVKTQGLAAIILATININTYNELNSNACLHCNTPTESRLLQTFPCGTYMKEQNSYSTHGQGSRVATCCYLYEIKKPGAYNFWFTSNRPIWYSSAVVINSKIYIQNE